MILRILFDTIILLDIWTNQIYWYNQKSRRMSDTEVVDLVFSVLTFKMELVPFFVPFFAFG